MAPPQFTDASAAINLDILVKPPILTVKRLTTVCCHAIYVCAVNLTLQDSVQCWQIENRLLDRNVLLGCPIIWCWHLFPCPGNSHHCSLCLGQVRETPTPSNRFPAIESGEIQLCLRIPNLDPCELIPLHYSAVATYL